MLSYSKKLVYLLDNYLLMGVTLLEREEDITKEKISWVEKFIVCAITFISAMMLPIIVTLLTKNPGYNLIFSLSNIIIRYAFK
jgi:hypothetical protein